MNASQGSIWIGFDPREPLAYRAAFTSIWQWTGRPILPVVLAELQARGLYARPTELRNGQLWDSISGAPMSTEFAISRFLVPMLAKELYGGDRSGWALFVDQDVLARRDIDELFALADDRYAVMCVQHDHAPPPGRKMRGQAQTAYARKNWSSVVLFNTDHPANDALTPALVNTAPGRDLHRFCWLADRDIGALPAEWNWLVGHSDPAVDPAIVHFTDGTPDMPGRFSVPFADEWRGMLRPGPGCGAGA